MKLFRIVLLIFMIITIAVPLCYLVAGIPIMLLGITRLISIYFRYYLFKDELILEYRDQSINMIFFIFIYAYNDARDFINKGIV